MAGPGTTQQAGPPATQAESYLRLRAEQELRNAVAQADAGAETEHPRATCAKVLAGALAALGAIPESTAVSVLTDLDAALAQRGLQNLGWDPEHWGKMAPLAGTMRASPAGVAAEFGIEEFGFPLRIRFGSLVTDGRLAWITLRAAYSDPHLTGPRAYLEGPELWEVLRGSMAADDLGTEYEVGHGLVHGLNGKAGGGMSFRWASWLELDPAPPENASWLEVTIAGQAPVRITLDRAHEPAVTTTALDPAGAADRYLDARSVALLTDAPQLMDRLGPADVVAMAADLLGAEVLGPDSPSLARLAAVAAREDLPLPGPLAAIPPTQLPADWARVQDRGAQGASGVVFAAAVLPEVEGVRCVITELASRPDITTMRVYAPGWPVAGHHFRGGPQHDDRYHWHASDDLGNGYAVTAYTGAGSVDGAEFPLRLHPPVSPQASELEVTLAGRSVQGSVRMPLDWQDDDWDTDAPDWQPWSDE